MDAGDAVIMYTVAPQRTRSSDFVDYTTDPSSVSSRTVSPVPLLSLGTQSATARETEALSTDSSTTEKVGDVLAGTPRPIHTALIDAVYYDPCETLPDASDTAKVSGPGFTLGARAAAANAPRKTRMAGVLLEDSNEDNCTTLDADASEEVSGFRELVNNQNPSPIQQGPSNGIDRIVLPNVEANATARAVQSSAEVLAAVVDPDEVPSSPPIRLCNGKRTQDVIDLESKIEFRPPSVEVDSLDSPHRSRPAHDKSAGNASPRLQSTNRHLTHGRRALRKLGFMPCYQAIEFGGTTRPLTPKHRPHSRVWLESYFSKTPLFFPDHFDVKLLSDEGIYLEHEGEKVLDFQKARTGGARCYMYADPMPGHLQPGGLFASGPGSPRKLKPGKKKDWDVDGNEIVSGRSASSKYSTDALNTKEGGHVLSINGLDPFDPKALRTRLSDFFWPHITPDEILIYPSLVEGNHDVVAYARFGSEHALQTAMERCRELGLRASRAVVDDLCKVQTHDESEEQVLAELHPSGKPFVTSPPMAPSPVLRYELTQALESTAKSPQASRPQSARTQGRLSPPLSAWGSSPPPVRPTSPLREAMVNRIISPYQRGPTFLPANASTPTKPEPRPSSAKHAISTHEINPAPSPGSRPPPASSLRRPVRPEKGSIPSPAAMRGPERSVKTPRNTDTAQARVREKRQGPSGLFVDLISHRATYWEQRTDKKQAEWGQALFDAPWG